MSINSISGSSTSSSLTGTTIDKLVSGFKKPISDAQKEADSAMNSFKAHPDNQALALEAQKAQGNLDRLYQVLSAIMDKMGKTLEAIIASMRG